MSEMNAQFKWAALGLAVDVKSLLSPHTPTPVLALTEMVVALSISVGQARLCSLRKVPVSSEGKAPGEVETLPSQHKGLLRARHQPTLRMGGKHRRKLPHSCRKAGKILLGNTGSYLCFCRWDLTSPQPGSQRSSEEEHTFMVAKSLEFPSSNTWMWWVQLLWTKRGFENIHLDQPKSRASKILHLLRKLFNQKLCLTCPYPFMSRRGWPRISPRKPLNCGWNGDALKHFRLLRRHILQHYI